MANNYIDGSDLMLFINDNSIAFATSCKLSINRETVDTTNKDEVGGKWVAKTAKKMSWSMTSENLYANDGSGNTFDDLFAAMISNTAITAVWGYVENSTESAPSANGYTKPTSCIYSGNVFITSLEANAPAGDNATYSVTFEGTGELKHTPPTKTQPQ